jgi:hypothetical protein
MRSILRENALIYSNVLIHGNVPVHVVRKLVLHVGGYHHAEMRNGEVHAGKEKTGLSFEALWDALKQGENLRTY